MFLFRVVHHNGASLFLFNDLAETPGLLLYIVNLNQKAIMTIINTQTYNVWSDSLSQYVTIKGKENLDNLNKELSNIVISKFPRSIKYDPIKEKEIFLKYK